MVVFEASLVYLTSCDTLKTSYQYAQLWLEKRWIHREVQLSQEPVRFACFTESVTSLWWSNRKTFSLATNFTSCTSSIDWLHIFPCLQKHNNRSNDLDNNKTIATIRTATEPPLHLQSQWEPFTVSASLLRYLIFFSSPLGLTTQDKILTSGIITFTYSKAFSRTYTSPNTFKLRRTFQHIHQLENFDFSICDIEAALHTTIATRWLSQTESVGISAKYVGLPSVQQHRLTWYRTFPTKNWWSY